MATAAVDPAECRDSRRFAALRELSAVQLVVGRRHRVRRAGLGADPPGHHAGRRVRLWLPVRLGVLPAADPVDQHPRRRHAAGGAGAVVRGVPGDLRSGGGRGAATARMADLVRGAVGGAGVVEVDHSLRRLPVGRGGCRSDLRPVLAAGPAGRRPAALVGDRADRLQRRRFRDGDRVVVAGIPSAARRS